MQLSLICELKYSKEKEWSEVREMCRSVCIVDEQLIVEEPQGNPIRFYFLTKVGRAAKSDFQSDDLFVTQLVFTIFIYLATCLTESSCAVAAWLALLFHQNKKLLKIY